MKSSTLHRAGLSRENMSVLENCATLDSDRSEYSRYVRSPKTPELDMLWRSVGRSTDIRTAKQKAPGVYLTIGFIAGALFMGIISLIASFANLTSHSRVEEFSALPSSKTSVAIIGAETENASANASVIAEEKYTVRSGDTLDAIAYRFYGQYDAQKIEKIQEINHIANPQALQIGQVLIIPVEHTR